MIGTAYRASTCMFFILFVIGLALGTVGCSDDDCAAPAGLYIFADLGLRGVDPGDCDGSVIEARLLSTYEFPVVAGEIRCAERVVFPIQPRNLTIDLRACIFLGSISMNTEEEPASDGEIFLTVECDTNNNPETSLERYCHHEYSATIEFTPATEE